MHEPTINTKPFPVCRLLLDQLPAVWSGEAAAAAVQQDEALVTHAPKVGLSLQHASALLTDMHVVPYHPLSPPHAVVAALPWWPQASCICLVVVCR